MDGLTPTCAAFAMRFFFSFFFQEAGFKTKTKQKIIYRERDI